MNMTITVYEFGCGGECVYMFVHTHAGIREMEMQMEKEDRHRSRVVRTSIGTVTYLSIKFAEKQERKQKDGHTYMFFLVLNPHSKRDEYSRNAHRCRCSNKEARKRLARRHSRN